jgi:hypothetical protein
MLLKSDYFPFFLKKKNNKQLLPMKPDRNTTARLEKKSHSLYRIFMHGAPHQIIIRQQYYAY